MSMMKQSALFLVAIMLMAVGMIPLAESESADSVILESEEAFRAYFTEREITIMLPTVLPDAFPEGMVPEFQLNQPNGSGDFDEGLIYYVLEEGGPWFGLRMRIAERRHLPAMLPSYLEAPQTNGLCYNEVEYTGTTEHGTFHWRQIYMLHAEDCEPITSREDFEGVFIYYELLSDTVDMDQLLTVAEHMR